MYCAARPVDLVELSITIRCFLSRYISRISYPSSGFISVTALALLRESYTFVQRVRFLHQFDRAYVSPFSKLRERRGNCRKPYHYKKKVYLRVLFAFSRLHHAHAGRLSEMIYQTLMTIGSHVTVGAPREHGMFGGVQ